MSSNTNFLMFLKEKTQDGNAKKALRFLLKVKQIKQIFLINFYYKVYLTNQR